MSKQFTPFMVYCANRAASIEETDAVQRGVLLKLFSFISSFPHIPSQNPIKTQKEHSYHPPPSSLLDVCPYCYLICLAYFLFKSFIPSTYSRQEHYH
jgi:hypothetical protein